MPQRVLSIVKNGHTDTCPAPRAHCSCEALLYATVGVLAFLGGIIQWVVGYHYSMAVLSDSLHALADASADFLGMIVAWKVHGHVRSGNHHEEDRLRTTGNKVIALLLAIGAIVVAYEAIERWASGTYLVSPPAIVIAGIFGLVIDGVRWRILARAHITAPNKNLAALIWHAKSDTFHSAIIAAVGVIALIGLFLPFQQEVYSGSIRVIDFATSLILAVYMLCVLSWRIWHGKLCGSEHNKCCNGH